MTTARQPWTGSYTLPEHMDIPQWLVDRDRAAARAELRAVLVRGTTDLAEADRIAHRVVPDPETCARHERAQSIAARGLATQDRTEPAMTNDDTRLDELEKVVAASGVGGTLLVDDALALSGSSVAELQQLHADRAAREVADDDGLEL